MRLPVDTGHGYLTTWLSGRLESPLLNHRLVYASCQFVNIITYCASQKKVAKVATSSQPPKTTPHSEAGPANIPDETKPKPFSAPNNVEVRVHFVRLAVGAHNNFFSEKLVDYRCTPLMLPFQCRYPHGCVVAVQTITVGRIKRFTSSCGCDNPDVYYKHLYHPLPVVLLKYPVFSLSHLYPYQCL